MDIIVRNDTVEISGYVNAVERDSKPLWDRFGQFIERICKGAFRRAIDRSKDIHVLLNHDWDRDIGSTSDGTLELSEDSIGLKARVVTDDPEIVEDARKGRLVGWSFGFEDRDVEEGSYNGMRQRIVKDLDLFEVSILNDKKRPAYEGTLINARDDEKPIYLSENLITEMNVREVKEEEKIDYTEFKNMIAEMKA